MYIIFQIIAGDPATFSFVDLIKTGNGLIELLFAFAAGSAVIAILWAAYIYMSSFGSEERIKRAKNIWYWTLIGLAVMMLAKVIIATGLRVAAPSDKLQQQLKDKAKF